MKQEFTVVGDDADIQVRHRDDHRRVSMRPSDADVVEFSSVAQRDRTPVVDVVVAHLCLREHGLSVNLTVALSSVRQACIGGTPLV